MKFILALALFFVFYSSLAEKTAGAGEGKKSAVKKSSAQKKIKKQTKNKRKTASEIVFTSKEDFLGEEAYKEYYEDFPSKPIEKDVSEYLNPINSLCKDNTTLTQKLDSLTKHFEGLNKVISKYLQEPNLKSVDEIMLRGIKANIDLNRIAYGQNLTKELVEKVNLRNSFSTAYFVHYNIPEDTKPVDFPDAWAQKIFSGINCLYKKE